VSPGPELANFLSRSFPQEKKLRLPFHVPADCACALSTAISYDQRKPDIHNGLLDFLAARPLHQERRGEVVPLNVAVVGSGAPLSSMVREKLYRRARARTPVAEMTKARRRFWESARRATAIPTARSTKAHRCCTMVAVTDPAPRNRVFLIASFMSDPQAEVHALQRRTTRAALRVSWPKDPLRVRQRSF
jgi:hypothetical protein